MAIQVLIDSKAMFILVVCIVLIAMGLVFETLSMVLIMVPVLLPAAMNMGIDPIWFGIFMVIMVECALITPPVGLNLYVIQSVSGAPLGDVARGVLPFLALMLFTVFVMYVWPDLALYIPFKLLYLAWGASEAMAPNNMNKMAEILRQQIASGKF